MKNYKSICVYCGSSNKVKDSYKKAAKDLGTLLAEKDIRLVYGGGRVGLMGIVADSVLEQGGEVLGIIPRHIEEHEVAHVNLSELRVVETMHERKQIMVDESDAFIILPGGLGTMDEFFEIITWRQLGLHEKPVIIVNIDGYWSPLEKLISNIVDSGFAHESNRRYFQFISDISEVPAAMARAPEETMAAKTKWM